jgi:ribonucleoside-diphosphate reductase alpha chain
MYMDNAAFTWLNNNELSYNIWEKKYRHNGESFQDWLNRVSGGNEDIKMLIYNKKFIFGGRTLANRGIEGKFSYSNCYSRGFILDDMEDIMDAAKDLAMTYKRGGGQGLSLSKIRPKGALIAGRYPSDGIVPFMELFNQVTASIQQGGARKGALLMALDVKHPQIIDFIKIKETDGKITNANLSVEIDNEFMQSVIEGKTLKVNNFGMEYEINPPEIFEEICKSAMKSAEPGVIFTDRFRNYNIMQFVDDYQIEICNPCGEQPLIKHGACSLCSINLSEYAFCEFSPEAEFDFDALKEDVRVIVRAMDDLIDENLDNHALEAQKEVSRKFRNIGIGVMGLADAFIKMGMTYGDEASIIFSRQVMNDIFATALDESVKLAEERGSFPGYTSDVWDSDIIKYAIDPEQVEVYKSINKLRNCALISIAPTGSIGTMLQTSTGCEPNFALEFNRKTVSLTGKENVYKVRAKIAQDYIDRTGNPNLPHYFVTAQDITPAAKVSIQSRLQNYCDTAISSTCNLKRDITLEEVKNLYIESWMRGLKGQTIYVEGSRDPILFVDKKEQPKEEPKTIEESEIKLDSISTLSRDEIGQCLSGSTYKYNTACGVLYITVNKDENGNIVEVFTNSSKNGTCKANLNGETRLISLALRAGVKVDEVADTLKSIQCQSCAFSRAKGNKIDGASCPDIIAKCIKSSYSGNIEKKELKPVLKPFIKKEAKKENNSSKCPECGESIIHEGGCISCSCGWSKCS